IKPFSTEHLSMTVRRCLDHRKLREELSSERTMRQELESAYQELQKVERLKESFIGRVSHELRTPLSQLLLGLRLLEEELQKSSEGKLKKGIEILNLSLQGAQRLEKTIFDLLAFVDMQHVKRMDHYERVDLEAACRKIAEKFKPLWEPLNLSVEIAFAPKAKEIEGDGESLEIAFEHMFHN